MLGQIDKCHTIIKVREFYCMILLSFFLIHYSQLVYCYYHTIYNFPFWVCTGREMISGLFQAQVWWASLWWRKNTTTWGNTS